MALTVLLQQKRTNLLLLKTSWANTFASPLRFDTHISTAHQIVQQLTCAVTTASPLSSIRWLTPQTPQRKYEVVPDDLLDQGLQEAIGTPQDPFKNPNVLAHGSSTHNLGNPHNARQDYDFGALQEHNDGTNTPNAAIQDLNVNVNDDPDIIILEDLILSEPLSIDEEIQHDMSIDLIWTVPVRFGCF